ncbi:MAG: FAD-dependent oxidoreductase [Deltaproteobacteria bacterium]|nr:FAD-dependent oxidoreductase [Deltaproteobacteria bacterium]
MKVAVIGSGISGLVAAHTLSARHDVVLFEGDGRIGGHTHTVDVPDGDGRVAVDTGFIVFNERTYPNFTALLRRLGVPWQESDMSFSVRSERRDFEYGSPGLSALFAQKRNLLDPRFHRMVRDILRFNREARELLDEGREEALLDWLARRGYSPGFVEDHLLPLVGAVWSSSRQGARAFPARFLARFFENHGFLDVQRRFPWLTIRGGSREYVRAILGTFPGEVRSGCPVRRITRPPGGGVRVEHAGGAPERFDHAVVAVHADQALELLGDPSPVEHTLLSAFPFRRNEVLLHSDARVMPRRRGAWCSWNYHLDDAYHGGASITYWMNNLQRLRSRRDWFVSLNRRGAVAPGATALSLSYDHPVFSSGSPAAQARHRELVGHRDTSYCGAYWRNGFHEDGVVSALRACEGLGVEALAA